MEDLTKQKERYFKWLDTLPTERVPKGEEGFARSIDVSPVVLHDWRVDRYQKAKLDIDYDSKKFLLEQVKTADKGLMDACKKGSSAALNTYYQLIGRLKEEQKINVVISADEIAKQNRKAERELESGGYSIAEIGVSEMQDELPVLDAKIRQIEGRRKG